MKKKHTNSEFGFFRLLCGLFAAAALFAACENLTQDGGGNPWVEPVPVSLKSLSLSDGAVLSPAFDSGITNYQVNVAESVETLTVTGEAEDDTHILSENNGVAQDLSEGSSTPITISVKSADGSEQSRYIVVAHRAGAGADSDPALNGISLSAGSLEPSFNADTTSYTAAVPFDTETLEIAASPNKETTLTAVNGPKVLEFGENIFIISSVAEDGTKRDYTVVATRGPDVSLETLTVSEGDLTPAFDPQVTSYTVQVGGHIGAVTVAAEARNEDAEVNGAGEKTLQVGKNTVTLTVSVENGGSKTYTIEITKAGNEDGSWIATLFSLSVERSGGDASGLALSPAFSPETFAYTVTGWHTEDAIKVSAVKTDAASGLDISPGEGADGVETASGLEPGNTTITVTVTSENGQVVNAYTILVHRKSDNTALKQITVDFDTSQVGVSWQNKYDACHYTGYYTSDKRSPPYDYRLDRTNGYTSGPDPNGDPAKFELFCDDKVGWVKFTVTPVDSHAVVGGDAGETIYLPDFDTYERSFTITAEDGVTQTTWPYIITREHVKSTDATLKSLTPSTGAFLQAFAPATTTYSMVVGSSVDKITITGLATHDTAVPGGTAAVVGGDSGVEKTLSTGSNTITITVTAEDGTTTKTYTVTVIRSTVDLGSDSPGAFTSLPELETWLKARSANTAADPYTVTLASSLSFDALKADSDGLGQLFTVLGRAGRYVTVNFSAVTGDPSAGPSSSSSRTGGDRLVEVILPSGITAIPNYMFSDCVNLKIINLSAYASLVSIGIYAFDGCSWEGALQLPASLTSIGNFAFSGHTGLTSVSLPASLTSIGNFAFSGCSGLQTLTLPSGLTSIGNSAFQNCADLTSVTFTGTPAIGSSAFGGCTSLATVTFSAGIKSIGTDAFKGAAITSADMSAISTASFTFQATAFSGCPNLETIKLPNTTTSWTGALSGVPKLASLSIPNTLSNIAETAFTSIQGAVPDLKFSIDGGHTVYQSVLEGRAVINKTNNKLLWGPSLSGEITVPSGVNVIGRYAFSKNTGVTKVIISGDVKTLDQYAFEGCNAVVDLSGAAKLKELPSYVFYNNKNMGAMTIPANIKNIRANAFNGAGLGAVTLTAGIENIEDSAFANSTLTAINFPSTIKTLGAAFTGTKLTGADLSALALITSVGGFSNCKSLASITLPPNLFTVGASAFEGCSGLQAVSLPSTVTAIGASAFKGCTAITAIDLPHGVGSVGGEAFSGSGLVSATFPDGLSSLGNSAFASCGSLQWVEFLYEEAPVTVNANAFPTTAAFSAIYVPDVLFTAYVGSEGSPSSWGNPTLRGKVARHSSKP